jgi:hypothetical protein
MRNIFSLTLCILTIASAIAQDNTNHNKFKQLKEEVATPNVYRNAAGAPGHMYYQNRADYSMNITLNDGEQKITGEETITYHNESPDDLEYLWIQLDQNVRAKTSDTYKIQSSSIRGASFNSLKRLHSDFDGGFKITEVSMDGKPLKHTINKTMMRIDLDTPLKAGEQVSFNINWWYNVNNMMEIGGRSGYEYFAKDDNRLYVIAQFYPRMCVYNDVEGWQNKQFLGRGEFTVPFGNYKVSLTVPGDHVVASTGTLANASNVLTKEQLERLELARKSDKEPVMIVTQKEAEKAEKSKIKSMKTWTFEAENVRDFGWASSKKFIWDAMVVHQETKDVMAMSFYPKEGNPLWEQYSTKAVAQTLKTYSSYTFDYPYPVAISVHAKDQGMEYPMICFNYGRPDEDGTYSPRMKYGMIGVIIHEVGHNYFPMIINSDERQWTWMDEGLNTFLQYLTEQTWERGFPSRRGAASKIVDYMKGEKSNISPIMTNSESVHQFGNNAYGKPATALNILRETIMGRELFDYAFKTYAQRWMFKHPTPVDFFRTMEDASAVDLDWFWRGWFYSTDHVDISMDDVQWFQISTKDPTTEKPLAEAKANEFPEDISTTRNKKDIEITYAEEDNSLYDFYNSYNPFDVTEKDKKKYKKFIDGLSATELAILQSKFNYYQLSFSNKGGLVMPLIIEFTFNDKTSETIRIPAEIWKSNNYNVSKVFFFEKEVISIELDPNLETADTDISNNSWPRKIVPTRFELYNRSKGRHSGAENPMKKAQKK